MTDNLGSAPDQALEEPADILEELYAISEGRGFGRDAPEAIRAEKAVCRGGFSRRLYLYGRESSPRRCR